jgi:hypothetical protein
MNKNLQQIIWFCVALCLVLLSYHQHCFANQATTKQVLFEKIEFVNSNNTKKATLFFNNNPEFKIFTLQNPPRLVCDLKNSTLSQANYQPVLPNFISSFRFRTQQSELRLVFDLTEELLLQNIATNHQQNSISFDLLSNNLPQLIANQKNSIDSKTATDPENNVIIKKTTDYICMFCHKSVRVSIDLDTWNVEKKHRTICANCIMTDKG